MLIWFMGLATIISAIMVILSRKVVNSVLYLILTFFNSAIIFILIGVPFIGFIYLLLYVGAISILFLFVIMMLDLKETGKEKYDLIGYIVGVILLIGTILVIGKGVEKDTNWNIVVDYHQEWSIKTIDTLQGIAYILYSEQISLLILIAILLLAVMVSIINSITKLD